MGPGFFRQNTSGYALGVLTPKASPSGWVFSQAQHPMIKTYNQVQVLSTPIFHIDVGFAISVSMIYIKKYGCDVTFLYLSSLVHGDIMAWPVVFLHEGQSSDSWAPFQYPIRRLIVRPRKVSKPRDLYLELSDRSEIWQAPRQHCCRGACQISKRYEHFKTRSPAFETLRDFTIWRLIGYWNGPLAARVPCSAVETVGSGRVAW